MKHGWCAILLLLFFSGNAQDTTGSLLLDEIFFYSGRFKEPKVNIVQQSELLTEKAIAAANAQSMGDLLSGTGNVFVQKSQQGGSSPVIRGFEASRILLIVDGVRMNNAIFRSGHLQNII